MISLRIGSHSVLAVGLLILTTCSGGSGATPTLDANKTVMSTGATNSIDTGVTGNGADVGDVTFAVPSTAPDPLFYRLLPSRRHERHNPHYQLTRAKDAYHA